MDLEFHIDQLHVQMCHLKIFSCKQLYTHDGEDQPKDQADQQHVEYTGDGLDQGIDNHLRKQIFYLVIIMNSHEILAFS